MKGLVQYRLWFLALLAVLPLTSCSTPSMTSTNGNPTPPGPEKRVGQMNINPTPSEEGNGTAQHSTLNTPYPITLTDALSHSVTLTHRPVRIVSLGPSVTETLFAIGVGNRVVADTRYDDYPPEAVRLPKVGDYTNSSSERILSFHPDLVVAVRGNDENMLNTLQRLHVPVFAVDPKTIEEVESTIRTLGQLTGNVQDAEQVARKLQASVQQVEKALQAVHPLTSIVEVSQKPLIAVGPGTFISDVLRLAGASNAAPASATGYPQLSYESVLTLNPQSLFIAGSGATPASVRTRPGWQQLAAVKSGRVFSINPDLLTRPAPRIVLALQEIARDLHPEAFPRP